MASESAESALTGAVVDPSARGALRPASLPALTTDELQALRAAALHPRDRALLEILAGCGLRPAELCGLTLDDRLPRLEHEAAALVLAQARARLERFRPAWRQQLISAQEYEQGEYQARLAELRCTEAVLALERTVLVAPIAGVVNEHRLQPGQPVAAGQECFRVEDPIDLAAELAVPVAILARVYRGQTVHARLTDQPAAPILVGRLDRLSTVIEPQSGGCLVTVCFPGAGRRHRPGTPVQIVLGKD